MKKTFTSGFLGLVISGLLLSACSQVATYESEDLTLEQAKADKGGFTLSPYGNTNGNENAAVLDGEGNCSDDCITDSSSDEFAATASSPVVSWGGPNQDRDSKVLSVKVWNTLTTIEYELTINTSANNAGSLQYYDEDLGDWVNIGSMEDDVPFSVSRPLPDGWSSCDVITEQWRQNGGGAVASLGDVSYSLIGICTKTTISEGTEEPICEGDVFTITASVESYGDFQGGSIQIWDENDLVVASADVTESVKSVSYDFSGSAGSYDFTAHYVGAGSNGYKDSASDPITVEVEECDDCDEESFSYNANVVNTDLVNIVFTYDASEALENAEVKFTFPQIQDASVDGEYIAPDEKKYSVNNDGNNTVFTWVGNIGCTDDTAVTFEFEVSADCNASGKAQIWTDAKVNGESVKNDDTPNIKFSCTDQEITESNED